MVLSVAYIRERERGSETRLRVTLLRFFCKHLQFLPGKQEAAPNFLKKQQQSAANE